MFTMDEYKVEFETGRRYTALVYGVHVLIKDITICTIEDEEGNKFRGASVRSYKDKNCTAKGREEAFTRVLEPFDKETRTRFWEAYFKAQGGVK